MKPTLLRSLTILLLLALLLAASFNITALADDEPETPQPEAPKEEPAVAINPIFPYLCGAYPICVNWSYTY